MGYSDAAEQTRRAILRFLLVVLVVAIGVVAAIRITRARLLAAPEQPLDYSHQTHVEAGIECLYCHSQATRAGVAGIPSVERCAGCHEVIAAEEEGVQELAAYWERGEAIPWARVNIQPDFVYFSHQPHTLAGLNCETCHGDVAHMDAVQPTLRMDMGWCLECHLQQDPALVARLLDCMTCHK